MLGFSRICDLLMDDPSQVLCILNNDLLTVEKAIHNPRRNYMLKIAKSGFSALLEYGNNDIKDLANKIINHLKIINNCRFFE